MTGIIRLGLLGLAMALSMLARDEYTRGFDKTISLKSGQRITLENKFGDVVVHAHAGTGLSIHADIHVSAPNQEQAKDYAQRVEILIEAASEVSIRTRYPDTQKTILGVHWSNVSYSVHYDVAVPESSPLQIRNAFGGVSVDGIKASSEITTSHGQLSFRNAAGTQRLQNSFGQIEIDNNAGDVAVETNNGGVTASDIAGSLMLRDRFASLTVARVSKGVSIDNGNGAVQLSDSGGIGDIRNSFGNVVVHNFHGDLTVNDNNAKIEALNVDGSATLHTNFGGILFSNIKGQLSVRANNSDVKGGGVGGAAAIVNSFGKVDIRDVRGNLMVESGNGAISAAGISGGADLKTSFALVEATTISGNLIAHNSNGAVHASRMKGADVTTSFGAVILDDVSGPIQVYNQNGSIEASTAGGAACQPITMRTSFAALRVRLTSDPNYRVSARTSFGEIRSDFPLNVSGSMSKDNVNGTLGKGGCDMKLVNNNGAIEILKPGQ